MKDTIANKKLIIEHFKGSEFFCPSGPSNFTSADATLPFMLFGNGWGEVFLKCICIQFESNTMNPHIEIEYSPCSKPSSYYYMELTQENIKKLPRTNEEYFKNFHSLMGKIKKDYSK